MYSCNKEYNNPYDRGCPSNLWSPMSLSAVLNQSTIVVTWKEDETHFDGFILEKSADSINWNSVTIGIINKATRSYNDSTNTPGSIIYYRIYAKADLNISGTTYSKGLRLPNLPLYSWATGHFYRFVVRPNIKWTDARNEAMSDSMKYNGLRGYLATITSVGENLFIISKILKGTGWIGASDTTVNGEWRWVTGPEGLEESGIGLLFWKGTGYQAKTDSTHYGPVNGAYQNWNKWNLPYSQSLTSSIWEPNDLLGIEFYAHITFFPSDPADSYKWNDLPNVGGTGDYAIAGYIIEYGGL